MNTETAEHYMRLFRAGRRADSRTQKAVRIAEGDESLRQKLSDQMEFDDQIVDVIHYIKPPENLRQKLRDVSSRPQVAPQRLRSHIFNPAIFTAILGVLLIVGFCVWQGMEKMKNFEGRDDVERMLAAASKMSGVELDGVAAGTTAGGLSDSFYMRGFEGFSVPNEIAVLPALGSRVYRMDGHPIAQMMVDRQNTPLLVNVFHSTDFGIEIPSDNACREVERDQWVGALRQHGTVCYLICFQGTAGQMKEFLKSLKKP